MLKKAGPFPVSIAPGTFMVGYNIGTGSITTIASSGASFGMALAWPPTRSGNGFNPIYTSLFFEDLLWLLYNKRKHMGEYIAGPGTNVMLGMVTLFITLMAVAGVIGIINLFK